MSEPNAIPAAERARPGVLQRFRWPLTIGVPLVILVVAAYFFITAGHYQETDNAYVGVAKVPVAPSIGGRVTEILVHENQRVKKGDVLFRLDSRDYETSVRAAAAQLANAELQVRAMGAAYGGSQASVAAAREALTYADREAVRQRRLAAAGVASQKDVDAAVHIALQARQQVAVAQQQAAEALANLGGDPKSGAATPAVLQARAQLERARLNASYTTVIAPSDGIVTRVEQVPLGSYVNASQVAFWLLSGQPWVDANFKEDQLANMKIGQPVTIKVDAYPDAKLTGKVASFSPGTGSIFSPLPAQNATGNWVKIVQRLPVRITFDSPPPAMAGRAGLSAKVKVDVRAPGTAG